MSNNETVLPAPGTPEYDALLAAAVAKLAGDKELNKKMREEKKKLADARRVGKSTALADLSADLGIEVPKLANSLHRTDKTVGDKTVQVLCGAKFRIDGISGSLDLYVKTGKGGVVTDAVENSVTEAQALSLRMLSTLEDAGFIRGEDDPASV